MLAWIIVFSLLGSVGAILGAALVLILPEKLRKFLVNNLVSYATGTLLGVVFLGLVPKALKESSSPGILVWLLVGILFFFVMEKLILWRHCHLPECDVHASAGPLLLIGDAFHNFTDGVIIAGAFLLSLPLGIATGLAVISHEIPQASSVPSLSWRSMLPRKEGLQPSSERTATDRSGCLRRL